MAPREPRHFVHRLPFSPALGQVHRALFSVLADLIDNDTNVAELQEPLEVVLLGPGITYAGTSQFAIMWPHDDGSARGSWRSLVDGEFHYQMNGIEETPIEN